ncbi:MAG: tRNA (adenosine(37)-N6)-threonylcarbamoyltransferase complex dimerization subunit type 1 TsaB, partial [Chitinophagales bacterium]
MAYLLHIETSSPLCSVALSNDADLIKEVFSDGENDHAAQLAVLIKNLFFEAGVSISDLSAVSVSAGPGSYTGLRIGVSTVKGICHALNIPLIDVSSLQAMATAASSVSKTSLLCPMIDARRMEVYCALYDPLMNEIEKEDARIIDETFFQTILQIKKIAFFGSGAEKAKNFLIHEN